jgi:hypothetical protein
LADNPPPDSVSVRIATSSIPRPTISGSGMPTGIAPMFARTLSCTRRIASSDRVPTSNRAVTIAASSRVEE